MRKNGIVNINFRNFNNTEISYYYFVLLDYLDEMIDLDTIELIYTRGGYYNKQKTFKSNCP